jgi:hypothetical protein
MARICCPDILLHYFTFVASALEGADLVAGGEQPLNAGSQFIVFI